ncbi:MAG: GNAT family N-acetyltransferase [Alphaproteobacteria bacterium]|nr:GNAT family N-acetyltransferase [Alphaproteobacteria bacterium]
MEIETQRLILRPPLREDFAAWALMEADESVKANTGSVQDERESWSQLLTIAGHWSIVGWGALCAIEKASGRFVGRFGPTKPFGWPCIEVGWMLLPEFQGKGFALEGAIAAMDFTFLQLQRPRVIHTIRPANIASQKLAAKLGSTNLGPIRLPPPYEDTPNDEWSQTSEQWQMSRIRLGKG